MAKTISFEVDVNDKEVDALNDSLEQTDKNLKKVEGESKKASAGLKDVGDNGGAIAILDSLTGGLATKTRDAAEATKLFNFQLKATRTAIIATGIGALVVSLGLIVAYWSEIQGVVTGVNAELEEQLSIQQQIVEETERELANLDASDNILKLQGRTEAEILEMKKERLQLVISEQVEQLRLAEEQLQNQIRAEERAGRIFNAISFGAASLFDFIGKSVDTLLGAFGIDIGAQDKAASIRGSIYDSLFGNKEGIEERKKEIADLESSILAAQNRVAGIILQQRQGQEGQEDTTDRGSVNLVSILTGQPMDQMEEAAFREMDIVQELADARNRIEAEARAERMRQAELEARHRQEQLNVAADSLSNFSGQLSNFGEENKAFAIASIITDQVASVARIISNTAIANSAAVAAFPLTAGMPFVAINTAAGGLGIANSILSAQKAISQLGGSGGTGDMSGVEGLGDTAAVGGGGAQAPDFNIVGTTQGNQIADAINNSQPRKAYVVSREMSTQQELDREIEETATF